MNVRFYITYVSQNNTIYCCDSDFLEKCRDYISNEYYLSDFTIETGYRTDDINEALGMFIETNKRNMDMDSLKVYSISATEQGFYKFEEIPCTQLSV